MPVDLEDSHDHDAPKRPGRARLILGGVGALGLIGLLFWAVNLSGTVPSTITATTVFLAAPSTTIQSSSATSAEPTTTTTYPRELGPLADLVPGVTGTLYAVIGNRIPEGVAWEADRGAIHRWPLPSGTTRLEFDASNHRYAFTSYDQPGPVATLHVFPRSGSEGATISATSFAWHPRIPDVMAAIIVDDSTETPHPRLATITFDNPGGTVFETIASVDAHDQLLAWHDWGFLLSRYDETLDRSSIILIDQSGNIMWEREANTAYPSALGDILLQTETDGFLTLVLIGPDTPSGDPGEPLAWAPLQLTSLGWSTDGGQLAFLVWEGGAIYWRLEIYDRQGNQLDSVPLGWRVWDVQWSPDDRFVIMPGSNDAGTHGVFVYDTETDTLTRLEYDDWVQWADLIEADTTLIDLYTAQGPNSRIEVLFDSPGLDTTSSEVSINISTDVELEAWFHTSAGHDLYLIDGPPSESPSCVRDGAGYLCQLSFARLEAETAGFWTLIADNHSPFPVDLDILVSHRNERQEQPPSL